MRRHLRRLVNAAARARRSVHSLTPLWQFGIGTEKPLAIGLPLWVRLQPDTSVHSSRASPCASHTFPRTDFALRSPQRTLWFYRTTSKARSLRHFLGKLEP